MGEPFSLDFRHEIYGYLSSRNSCSSAGKVFGFSSATAVLYEAGYRERCKAVAKIQGWSPGQFSKLTAYVSLLTELIRAEPGITLHEVASALEETHWICVYLSSIHRVLVQSSFSQKTDLSLRNANKNASETRGEIELIIINPRCVKNHTDWLVQTKQNPKLI